MDIITVEEMRIADRNSGYLGVSPHILMENAGRGVADVINNSHKVEGKKIVVFCGLGNNGGDGFVAARHLAGLGATVCLILMGHPDRIHTPEALRNWIILDRMRLTVNKVIFADFSESSKVKDLVSDADIVVDAILGTGFSGKLKDPITTAVNIINSSTGLKVAVDAPTGVDASTGKISDGAVEADLTITFHKAKPGLLKAHKHVGQLIVTGIGIPPEAEIIAGPGDVEVIQKSRGPYAKKGEFGKILVIGGGSYYHGAPIFVAFAALRAGADLAIIATPSSVVDAVRSFSPNLIVRSLPGDVLTEDAIPSLKGLIDWASCVAIGPGLGVEAETTDAVLQILDLIKESNKSTLVDADAIKAMAEKKTILNGVPAVLTPHAGEYAKLTGEILPPPEELEKRIDRIMKTARELGVVLLLKGHEDIISDGKRYKINTTGNPGMTVGGTGDVLSGVASTFLSQGSNPFRAAISAAFINGRAGDLAVDKLGHHIVATDVIEMIPKAIRECL
ncbi:MAG: NAD(P)H-hydrate dehydratase [Candidatus Hodarchaeota archaeon]